MLDVSIIMINYKTPNLCIECVESIKKMTRDTSYEIIIVDNNSADGSCETLSDHLSKDISLIQSDKNLGTTKANNLGAKEARGRYLLFLNSDTLLLNDYIGILTKTLDSNADIGACVGNFYDVNLNPTHSYRRHFSLEHMRQDAILPIYLFRSLLKKRLNEQFNYTNDMLDIFYICCAGMLIRKEDFWNAGGYDEDIFMYGEEPIICKKLWNSGRRCVSVPQAKLQHLEGASFANDKNSIRFNPAREDRIQAGTKVFFDKCCEPANAYAMYLRYMSQTFRNQAFIKKVRGQKAETAYFRELSQYYAHKVKEHEAI